jgi:hypothetical protein
VSTQWLRALCPADRMPVCSLGLGSSPASGIFLYFYNLNLNTLLHSVVDPDPDGSASK